MQRRGGEDEWRQAAASGDDAWGWNRECRVLFDLNPRRDFRITMNTYGAYHFYDCVIFESLVVVIFSCWEAPVGRAAYRQYAK
jgi:hypothetical protein